MTRIDSSNVPPLGGKDAPLERKTAAEQQFEADSSIFSKQQMQKLLTGKTVSKQVDGGKK